MLKLLLISIILLVICFLALGIGVWVKGKFPDTEVGHNPHMRKLGICCAKEDELKIWKNKKNNSQTDCNSCSSCWGSNCNI